MRADDLRRAVLAIHADRDAIGMRREMDALCFQAEMDAFLVEDVQERRGNILVLPRNQARALLHHRHLAAEAAHHLREFEADITAADDHEVAGQGVEGQQRTVGQRAHVLDAGHVGYESAASDIQENLRRRQDLAVDVEFIG
jgi:hypothetical protein